jgi:hypothetical protein
MRICLHPVLLLAFVDTTAVLGVFEADKSLRGEFEADQQ